MSSPPDHCPSTPSSSPHPSVASPSTPPTPSTLPPSYPSSPTNPPGLLSFRPTHLRTPAPSPMRVAAQAERERALAREMVGGVEEVDEEKEVEVENGDRDRESKSLSDSVGEGPELDPVGDESESQVANHDLFGVEHRSLRVDLDSLDVQHNPSVEIESDLHPNAPSGYRSSHDAPSPDLHPNALSPYRSSPSPPSPNRGRRYTVALIDEGARASTWSAPRRRTPVPPRVRMVYEDENDGEGEEDVEEDVDVEEGAEDRTEDEREDHSGEAGREITETESESESSADDTVGRASVRGLVPLLNTPTTQRDAVSALTDVEWPAGSSAEESSSDEDDVSGGDEAGLGRIPEENEGAGPRSSTPSSSESIHMVSHADASDLPRSEYEPLPGGGEGALVESQTYFLHLPLADRPRRGRGPRGGAQVHRLGWWVSGLVEDE